MKLLPPNRYGVPAAIHTPVSYPQTPVFQAVAPRAEPARYFLKPGELFVGAESAMVETLLGSCVSIALFSTRHRVGAVCHSLLPTCRRENPCRLDCQESSRYVDCSIRRMLEWFLERGIKQREIVVKLFGGSDLLAGPEGSGCKGVGQQNIDRALQVIAEEGLFLAASDVGGVRGRKIVFKTYTGEVFLKRLSRTGIT
jgi:chemotaxis protein CheD